MSGIYHTEYSFKGLHSTARRAAQKVSFVGPDIIRLPFAVFPSSFLLPFPLLSFPFRLPIISLSNYIPYTKLI